MSQPKNLTEKVDNTFFYPNMVYLSNEMFTQDFRLSC